MGPGRRNALTTKKLRRIDSEGRCHGDERSNSPGVRRLNALPLANRNAGTMGRLLLRNTKVTPSRLHAAGHSA
jgi:hypothetical protein